MPSNVVNASIWVKSIKTPYRRPITPCRRRLSGMKDMAGLQHLGRTCPHNSVAIESHSLYLAVRSYRHEMSCLSEIFIV